jgi:hypothetical protein
LNVTNVNLASPERENIDRKIGAPQSEKRNNARHLSVDGSIGISYQMSDLDVAVRIAGTALETARIKDGHEDLAFISGGKGCSSPQVLTDFLSPRVYLQPFVDAVD